MKRDQLAATNTSAASFSWIQTSTFPSWLRTKNAPPFWIKGKPGTGKSTLMKHLADSKSTLDTLGEKWTVVHFFFDYRARKGFANSISGMMKLFLLQLTLKVQGVEEQLNQRIETLDDDKVETYIDGLSEIVNKFRTNICAFIDGLDEYEGDLGEICSLIERLHTRTGMKICLASRPEIALERLLGRMSVQTITMQDHNTSAIEVCVQHKVAAAESRHPHIYGFFTEALQKATVEKAQGVILWASLTTDEMIRSMTVTKSWNTDMARSILDSLPVDIEKLYERMLGKLTSTQQVEAAILLALIAGLEGVPCTAAVLCEALNFILVKYENVLRSSENFDETLCQLHVKGLLGNLVEFVRPPNSSTHYVRLVHKSITPFLERNDWLDNHLLSPVMAAFRSGSLWREACTNVLKLAAEEGAINDTKMRDILKKRIKVDREVLSQNNYCLDDKFQLISEVWVTWKTLLFYCIDHAFDFNWKTEPNRQRLAFPQTASTLALLSILRVPSLGSASMFSYRTTVSRLERLHDNHAMSFALEIVHLRCSCIVAFFNSPSHKLEQSVLDDLLDVVIYTLAVGVRAQLDQLRYPSLFFDVIKALLSSGASLAARHYCILVGYGEGLYELDHFEDDRSGAIGLILRAAKLHNTRSQSQEHDKDCQLWLYGSSVKVAHHWVLDDWKPSQLSLKLALALCSNADTAFNPYGSVYHAILTRAKEHDADLMRLRMNNEKRDIEISRFYQRFKAAASLDLPPYISGEEQSALKLAKKMKRSARTKALGLPTRLNMFLDYAIESMEEFEKRGRWGSVVFESREVSYAR